MTKVTAIVSDMDGVLWRGDQPLPGLSEFFAFLRQRELPFMLATNNSSKSPADYVAKLKRLGVDGVPESAILTSGIATAAYLRERYPAGTRVYVVGGSGLRQAVTDVGFVLADSEVEIVVAGLDRQVNYGILEQATYMIRNGAHFVGTNPDVTFPTEYGQAPGAGSILAALAAATGCQPLVIGKPYPPMFKIALERLGHPASSTLMIGDRLNTDITGAAEVGMRTALVLTGVSTEADLNGASPQPDAVYPDLPALIESFQS